MNLIDLINRKDRALKELSPGVCISAQVREKLKMRTVELPPCSRITIDDAQEFDSLKSCPPVLGWKWSGRGDSRLRRLFRPRKSGVFQILLINEEAKIRDVLFSTRVEDSHYWHEIVLQWPPIVAGLKRFSLVLTCQDMDETVGGIVLGIAPAFNSRESVPKFIKGAGVEIGPGLNPQIVPSNDVAVRYVETAGSQEWLKLYKKTGEPSREQTEALWKQYIVSDASFLDEVEDNSLDFIFSNHVFEHLMNPIGVLQNWRRKLRPSGLIYNVVPDANCSFDLRQPLSHIGDWWGEYENETWQPDLLKYNKWCKYTAPYNTAEDLIKRQYSIHVHYYTPKTAAQLANILVEKGVFSNYFIRGAWNHKDFAMILCREETDVQK